LISFDLAGIFILDTEVRNLLPENTFQLQHDHLLNEYRVFYFSFSCLTDKRQPDAPLALRRTPRLGKLNTR